MGRTQRALTSLVAAIPAGFLAYILVMAFLNQADSLTTMIQIVLGVTLACAVLVVLMPFGLLIFGGERAARPDAAAAKAAPAKRGAVADDDEAIGVADDDGGDLFDDSSEDVGLEASDDEILADSDDEISASSSATMDAFDFDEDEDEPPKKKKK